MRSDEQQHVAHVVAHCRDGLQNVRLALDGQVEEASSLEAISARLLDVEHTLLHDVQGRHRHTLLVRTRELTSPRLGLLYHHPPEPLLLPTRYWRADPPHPAPTISVVTPAFQHGPFLERTIYSVLNQRYPALEYVVRDGGSNDGTHDILRRYDDALTWWSSAPDSGQADAINSGFEHTTGEIMAYLNSDDLLLPGSLAYVANYFATHPEVDAVYGHRVMIDEHDRRVGSWVLPAHNEQAMTLVDLVPQETLFWRRRIWRASGAAMDPSFYVALDWDLLLRFRESGARMVRLPRYLGAFRVHSAQKTAVASATCLSECDRLRLRTHGRGMSHDEAWARLAPYLRRHVLHHTVHRVAARLPGRRSRVRTIPLDGELATGTDLCLYDKTKA